MEQSRHTIERFRQTLLPPQRERFDDAVRRQKYRRDELIVGAGLDCLGVMFVRSGVIRVSLLSAEGRQATISRISEGEACLLSAACRLSPVTFDVQVQAETDCIADVLPAGLFEEMMRENLRLENLVYKMLTARFSDVVNALQRMYFMTLRQRVAAFLLGEVDRTGQTTLPLTQEQIALAIASAREAVNRTLRQLAGENLVQVERGSVKILNVEALRAELAAN